MVRASTSVPAALQSKPSTVTASRQKSHYSSIAIMDYPTQSPIEETSMPSELYTTFAPSGYPTFTPSSIPTIETERPNQKVTTSLPPTSLPSSSPSYMPTMSPSDTTPTISPTSPVSPDPTNKLTTMPTLPSTVKPSSVPTSHVMLKSSFYPTVALPKHTNASSSPTIVNMPSKMPTIRL